ncbi:MAG: mannose-1-phosphate guanylyltransferase/mannose-6-phosphate isomerase [Amaricoccus sp.]
MAHGSTKLRSLIPVILCGGAGSRLWPLSRRDFAKQHVSILGGPSLFERTLHRVAGAPFDTPIAITAVGTRFLVAEQADGMPIEVALEPEGRGTLPAVTAAVCLASRRDPEAIVLVMPSDHFIPDVRAFAEVVTTAAGVAEEGYVVTLGLAPTEPATGYGYIGRGAAIGPRAYAVRRFLEKPDAVRAAELIEEGCLWNAGIFCFRADCALREIEELAPEALAAVQRAIAGGEDDFGALKLGNAFREAPNISFDHAVMERTKRAAVVEVELDWSDIGDWKAVWEKSPRDERGVARQGHVFARDVANSYLRSDGRLVCALGLDGLAVIDTADAVLVAPIERSQEVRELVADLEAGGLCEARTPARVHRPWGWYQTMDRGDRFRVKRILVHPGRKLSLQRHHHRAEHWVVVRGTAEVTRDGEVTLLRENESLYLPLGCLHRLANPGKIPVEIIEVQTGSYLEEDDILRVEDDFGRD